MSKILIGNSYNFRASRKYSHFKYKISDSTTNPIWFQRCNRNSLDKH